MDKLHKAHFDDFSWGNDLTEKSTFGVSILTAFRIIQSLLPAAWTQAHNIVSCGIIQLILLLLLLLE